MCHLIPARQVSDFKLISCIRGGGTVARERVLCYILETFQEWAVLVLPKRNIGSKGPQKCYEIETLVRFFT